LPFGSNLDEFHLLGQVADVRWARDPNEMRSADLIILPGSKHVVADMAWMRDRGVDLAVHAAAARGIRVIGVCGGAMMLGSAIHDPFGVEGGGSHPMLGLLPIDTTMAAQKVVQHVSAEFDTAGPMFGSLAGLAVDGYEIRYGHVDARAVDVAAKTANGPVAWQNGNVLATVVHGLFEDERVIETLLGMRTKIMLDDTFDMLADAVSEHLDTELLVRLITR
jgi:adenosylcobyric acid synthase